jgi:hypothetical protein
MSQNLSKLSSTFEMMNYQHIPMDYLLFNYPSTVQESVDSMQSQVVNT